MKRTTISTVLCGILGLGASLAYVMPASAADDITISRPHSMKSTLSSRFYVGANLGYATYDEIGDSSASFGLFGGYHINEVLAVDFGWSSLGEASKNSVTADVSVLQVGLLGKLPLRTDLTLFGKIGLANWGYDLTSPISDSDSDIDSYLGVGADYSINGRSAMRFELDLYSMKPDFSPTKEKISVFSVGFMFKP